MLPEPALRGYRIGMMLLLTVLLLEEHVVVEKKMRHPPQPLPPVGMRVEGRCTPLAKKDAACAAAAAPCGYACCGPVDATEKDAASAAAVARFGYACCGPVFAIKEFLNKNKAQKPLVSHPCSGPLRTPCRVGWVSRPRQCEIASQLRGYMSPVVGGTIAFPRQLGGARAQKRCSGIRAKEKKTATLVVKRKGERH